MGYEREMGFQQNTCVPSGSSKSRMYAFSSGSLTEDVYSTSDCSGQKTTATYGYDECIEERVKVTCSSLKKTVNQAKAVAPPMVLIVALFAIVAPSVWV